MSNEIEKSFNATIASTTIETVKDYVELGLDSILNDGLLKDVPIMGTLVSLFKIGGTLKDRHTFKKIAVFLDRLSDIPLEERERFVNHTVENDDYDQSISEKVLLMLERLDETKKAVIIGNLFKMYVMEILPRERFFRLASIVERAFLGDLEALHQRHSTFRTTGTPQPIDALTRISLTSLGLYQQKIDDGSSSRDEVKLAIRISVLGKELANYMYYEISDPKFVEHMRVVKSTVRRQ